MTVTKLGYARVSTNQQDLKIQIDHLIEAGVKNHPDYLFTDKASGKNDDRSGLKLMQTKVREGDHIIITKLDRLGRNTSDMIKIIDDFHSKGVSIEFLDDGISTKGTMARMVMTILSAVAEAERHRILERTNEGRRAAVLKGVKMGRKSKFTDKEIVQIRQLVTEGQSKSSIAKQYGVSRQTVYNLVS
jgi:DNA invertase Pin-like site-specific DNA recombinase